MVVANCRSHHYKEVFIYWANSNKKHRLHYYKCCVKAIYVCYIPLYRLKGGLDSGETYLILVGTKMYHVVMCMLIIPTLLVFDSDNCSFNEMFHTITLRCT